MTDDGELQFVAAAYPELPQPGVRLQGGGDIAVLQPGDLALLGVDVGEEQRLQAGEPVAQFDEVLEPSVGVALEFAAASRASGTAT
jgi:hypothetical protein